MQNWPRYKGMIRTPYVRLDRIVNRWTVKTRYHDGHVSGGTNYRTFRQAANVVRTYWNAYPMWLEPVYKRNA